MKKVIVILVLAATQMVFSEKVAVTPLNTSDSDSSPLAVPDSTKMIQAQSEKDTSASVNSVMNSLNIKPTVNDSTSKSISKKYESTEESVKDIYKKEIDFKRSKETTETLWLVSRITLGVSSIGMATLGFLHTNDAEDKLATQNAIYKEYTELNGESETNEFQNKRGEYDTLESEIDTHIAKASIYYGLSFFLAAGFCVTFAF